MTRSDQPLSTEQLIAELSGGLRPVRRLRTPLLRTSAWFGMAGLLAIALGLRYADVSAFIARMVQPGALAELIGMFLTGALAALAAFHLSVPGASRRWLFAPLPPLLLWLAGSGYGCLQQFAQNGWGRGVVGEGAYCFVFIVLAGVPLAGLLFWMLRRARPLLPGTVAALGALGVAAMAAFILAFFHPFDVTVIDLGFHFLAVVVVLGTASLLGRPLLSSR